MHRLRSAILLVPVLLAACQATPATSPLLQKVQQIKADGTLAPVADKELTPFQQLVRARILPQLPFDVLALEMDRPEGEGTEGAYFAIIHTSGSVELRYYEQNDHLPRVDRYFHRALLTAEIGELNGFLKTHTLMQMAAHAAVPVETPATQPATQPATLPAVLSDSPPAPASEATATDDSAPAVMATVIRITQAHAKESRTLLLDSPAKDQPADQLLQLLIRFRETGTLACSYLQSFPPSARMLFSDPHRKVLQVWTHGEDLRVSITPKPADPPAENPESQWFAFRG